MVMLPLPKMTLGRFQMREMGNEPKKKGKEYPVSFKRLKSYVTPFVDNSMINCIEDISMVDDRMSFNVFVLSTEKTLAKPTAL